MYKMEVKSERYHFSWVMAGEKMQNAHKVQLNYFGIKYILWFLKL